MNDTISRFAKINRELRYGVIYVVASMNRNIDADRVDTSQVVPRLIEWLRRLTKFNIEIVDDPSSEGTALVARRINVGNSGKDAIVKMPLSYGSFSDVSRFVETATDVLSTDEGDMMLESEGLPRMSSNYVRDEGFAVQHESRLQHRQESPKRSWLGWMFRKKDKDEDVLLDDARDYCADEEPLLESRSEPLPPSPPIEGEEAEILTIEQEREKALLAIQAQILDFVTKYHADPSQLINTLLKGKIVVGQNNHLSPLVVNNDLKIVLPYYNEVEVKMPAMCRAIYILFLMHHEGIALRDVVDHRAELEDIYSMVMPGRSEEKAREAIDNLVDPMSNTLNEYISKIKRCFKLCILDEELAASYIITGKRGEPYRIALTPELITLPRAVTGE